MSEITIREMDQNEDFSAWYWEHLEEELDTADDSDTIDQHYLILSNEIGDWVGGLRYWLRGGVAHLVDVMVLPDQRHRGHAPTWPSSGPTIFAPKDCSPPWGGAPSSAAITT
jgi:hypothetical protein